jgi:phosphoribosyl 1,2-cyclic phosphodiesterase
MRVISLQSGSNGNCIYVEADGVRLLFDAGISGRQARERLARHGRDTQGLHALLVSHEHADHARHMGIYHRQFRLPVYVTSDTFRAASRYRLGPIADLNHFSAGESLHFGKVVVETYSTPHDSVDGVVFVVDDGQRRLGILTDLGHVFAGLESLIASLDAVLLESNYDPEMLARGGYPEWLKVRITGPGGHISNLESAELLRAAGPTRLQWACLGHMSHDNNTPHLALATHRRIVGDSMPFFVATRYAPSEVMEV